MSELSAYQKKIFPIDDHVGCSIAGLTSDGRLLRCALYRIHTKFYICIYRDVVVS